MAAGTDSNLPPSLRPSSLPLFPCIPTAALPLCCWTRAPEAWRCFPAAAKHWAAPATPARRAGIQAKAGKQSHWVWSIREDEESKHRGFASQRDSSWPEKFQQNIFLVEACPAVNITPLHRARTAPSWKVVRIWWFQGDKNEDTEKAATLHDLEGRLHVKTSLPGGQSTRNAAGCCVRWRAAPGVPLRRGDAASVGMLHHLLPC